MIEDMKFVQGLRKPLSFCRWFDYKDGYALLIKKDGKWQIIEHEIVSTQEFEDLYNNSWK